MDKKAWLKRILVYLVGIMVLALGITLNTKTNLGVSPVISVAYVAADIGGFGLGATTFVWYMFLIVLQLLMLGKEFKPWQFLQVIMSFLTSWFIDIYDAILPMAEDMIVRLILLAAAIVITSVGIHLTVGMDIVPNPADGLANVLGRKIGKNLGLGKNVLDGTCILISIILGLTVSGHLVGIGIGTVLTTLFTGRVVAFLAPWLTPRCRNVVEATSVS